KRAGAIFVEFDQCVLGVPNEELESLFSFPITNAIPIIRAALAHKLADGRIKISRVQNHQHVINQVCRIEQNFVLRITGAVSIFTLETKVGLVFPQTIASRCPKSFPGGEISIGHSWSIPAIFAK